MTILAREAGIPTRYVEGFVVNERALSAPGHSELGEHYVVRVEHAHAFPEVWIEGQGWVIFEPTIADTGEGEGGYSTILMILVGIGGAGVLTGTFLLIAMPQIREIMFRRRARKSTRETQVQLLYERIYTAFMRTERLSARTLSSRDLDGLAEKKYGLQIRELTASYDRVVYGNLPAASSDSPDFYEIYVKFCEAVKTGKIMTPLDFAPPHTPLTMPLAD
jgi:hypothetical protein